MFKCIIIEDQAPAQRILKKYIADVDYLELLASFSDAISAAAFLKDTSVDLIFLDIHLPKISGIDFLSTMTDKPSVILTTAFPNYALESYEYDVLDYLLKPFSFQRFVKAVAKLPTKESASRKNAKRDFIFIKSGYEHIKIMLQDILFIKSEADYTEVFTLHKKHLSSYSLKYWLEELGEENFIQVHRSYIVNGAKIVKVAANHIHFQGGHKIPIGRVYRDAFTKDFLRN